MSDKKMTIREGFEKARALYEQMGDAEMVAFFDGRIDQLNKKNSAERKPSPKQVENEALKGEIAGWMEHGVQYTAADVAKTCPACEGFHVNKISALLSQMGKSGVLTVTEEKRKHYYALA